MPFAAGEDTGQVGAGGMQEGEPDGGHRKLGATAEMRDARAEEVSAELGWSKCRISLCLVTWPIWTGPSGLRLLATGSSR